MDEFGMQLKLTIDMPHWARAEAYARAMRTSEGDEDVQLELLDEYLPDGGPDDVLGELSVETIALRDVASVRELYQDARNGSSEWAIAEDLPGGISFACRPNTGADELVERLWRQGVLSAAGFMI